MIETETPAQPTVADVVAANLHRTLRVLARVARAQGASYEGPSLLIARDLYGPEMINISSWETVYGGRAWDPYDVSSWSGRTGTPVRVSASMLAREAAAHVSRETSVTVPAPVADEAVGGCTCNSCPVEGCTGVSEHEDRGDQELCDDHGCEQCYGDGYSCDDHDCEHCFDDHNVSECCGWCGSCETHPGGAPYSGDSEVCSNCGYCHDCGHVCEDA